jgi:hypothetical protein
MHVPLKKNTSLKAAAICFNNRNNTVAEYEICLLKKIKAQLLFMFEDNTMFLKDNNVTFLPKNPAVPWKVTPFF